MTAAGAPVGGCASTKSCTADAFGFSQIIVPRQVVTANLASCAKARLQLVETQPGLDAVWEEVMAAEADSGISTAAPAVDFTRQRVVVRVGPSAEGISWAAINGANVVLGFLACSGAADDGTCSIDIELIDAAVSAVESRSCDTVNCQQQTNHL